MAFVPGSFDPSAALQQPLLGKLRRKRCFGEGGGARVGKGAYLYWTGTSQLGVLPAMPLKCGTSGAMSGSSVAAPPMATAS
jgi:hypothetical protein